MLGVLGQMAEVQAHDARDRIEPADEEVEGVTDEFVVGERAAAYFGLDAIADEIVARVAPAIGDDFAHITGDVAHRIAHRVQVRFVQQVMRSEEHTSELQSLMRISYAVFCLKKKKTKKTKQVKRRKTLSTEPQNYKKLE